MVERGEYQLMVLNSTCALLQYSLASKATHLLQEALQSESD